MRDLIRREELKEALFIKFGNQLPNGLFDEIDKAPVIDTSDLISKEDLENSFICGYRVKDLIIFGKMFHDNGIKREDLTKYSEAYLDGYKRAYDEINEAIQKTVDSIVSKEEV